MKSVLLTLYDVGQESRGAVFNVRSQVKYLVELTSDL